MKTNQNRIFSPMGLRICLYILLLAFGSCNSCKKDNPASPNPISTLPLETQDGNKTLGFLMNGQAWIPTGSGAFGAGDPVIGGYRAALPPVYYNSSNVWIIAYNPRQTFTIYLRNVDKVGIYNLNFETSPKPDVLYPQNYASFVKRDTTGSGSEFYMTNKDYTGQVEITKADTVNRIVSGRFSFKAIDTSTGKTIEVTNGRFDCKTGL